MREKVTPSAQHTSTVKVPEGRTFNHYFNLRCRQYLERDNPARNTAAEKFFGFFSKQGAEGRQRALQYQQHLSRLLEHDLFAQVMHDVSQNLDAGLLGSSKQLRFRLLQSLCDFLGITRQQVDAAMQPNMAFAAQAHTYTGINLRNQLIDAMKSLVRQAQQQQPRHPAIAAMEQRRQQIVYDI